MNWFSKSNPLAERARSPFYGSFIISWIIWNWRVVLSVLLLTKEDFGKLTLIEFIATKYLNTVNCIVIPMLMTITFTLLLPWVDYFIVWYTEISRRKKIEKQLEVGKKYAVSGIQYNELWEKHEQEKARLTTIENDLKKAKIEIEKEMLLSIANSNEIQTLQTEKAKIAEDSRYVNDLLTRLQNRTNASKFLNGRWTCTTIGEETKNAYVSQSQDEKQIQFMNQDYMILNGAKMEKESEIGLMDFDPDSNTINFARLGKNGLNTIVELTILNPNRLEGKENRRTFIYYSRTVRLDLKSLETTATEN